MAEKKAAPVKRRPPAKKKKKTRTKKTMITKARPFALPAGAGIAFFAPYLRKAKETGTSILDLIMADFENLDLTGSMERLKGSAIPTATLGIGGIAINKLKPFGKYSGIMGDLILGLAAGNIGKATLDPPSSSPPANSGLSERGPGPGRSARSSNPYEVN